MKKINLLVMSLVSAAALSFSSCSSDNDLGGGASGGNSQVDGFYMTLAIQTPTSNGTRTAQSNEAPATADESAITSGTFYLVDSNNEKVWSKRISEDEFKNIKFEDKQTGKTQLQIEVEDVVAGTTYKVYFLANTQEAPTPWKNTTFQATEKFVNKLADPKNFAMFNQNDKGNDIVTGIDGHGYTVVFKDENKKIETPAEVKYNNAVAPIKIERITARIDRPTQEKSDVIAELESPSTSVGVAEISAMKDAKNKVKSIKMTKYAIANLANTSYIMQHWNDNKDLLLPTDISDFAYWQPKKDFGDKYTFKGDKLFYEITDENHDKNYVFENNSELNPTTMYFEYKVTLDDSKFTNPADFADGTFYRYNNKIYNSFAEIRKAYNDVEGLFEGKTDAELIAELKAAKDDTTDPEAKIAAFRQKYDIEVFNKGKTYYSTVIKDNFIGYDNAIQRNTVYQLKVNNVYNVGAQVPNGTPDKTALFYLDVTVSVNPWVLNTQDVNLQ